MHLAVEQVERPSKEHCDSHARILTHFAVCAVLLKNLAAVDSIEGNKKQTKPAHIISFKTGWTRA